MAGSVNKVILVGRLGKDPEIRTLGSSGNRVANLSLATSESWKDKNSGERKEQTEWHRVVCFNDNITTVIEKFLKKGASIYLEGQIKTRKWQDKDGADRYSTEIEIGRFNGVLVMLDGKRDGGDAEERPASPARGPVAARAAMAPPTSSDIDDTIPF